MGYCGRLTPCNKKAYAKYVPFTVCRFLFEFFSFAAFRTMIERESIHDCFLEQWKIQKEKQTNERKALTKNAHKIWLNMYLKFKFLCRRRKGFLMWQISNYLITSVLCIKNCSSWYFFFSLSYFFRINSFVWTNIKIAFQRIFFENQLLLFETLDILNSDIIVEHHFL